MFFFKSMNSEFVRKFNRENEKLKFRPELRLCLFEEDGYSLNIFGLWIPLLFWKVDPNRDVDSMESWGVSLYSGELYLTWGSWYKITRMPWDRVHLRTEVRTLKGWNEYKFAYSDDNSPTDNRVFEYHPYTYTLRSGERQYRVATIYQARSIYTYKALLRWPIWTWKNNYIEIKFDEEIGESVSTWKGGTVGCSYEMLPGETPLDTLRRMQRDRKFR